MENHIRRIVPNINTSQMDESLKFYSELLGLKVAMNMDWIVTLISPDNSTAQVSLLLVKEKPVFNDNFSLTIEVGDVDAIHTKAIAKHIGIIYPLTNEPWGVKRFHVMDPNGIIINIMGHITSI